MVYGSTFNQTIYFTIKILHYRKLVTQADFPFDLKSNKTIFILEWSTPGCIPKQNFPSQLTLLEGTLE